MAADGTTLRDGHRVFEQKFSDTRLSSVRVRVNTSSGAVRCRASQPVRVESLFSIGAERSGAAGTLRIQ